MGQGQGQLSLPEVEQTVSFELGRLDCEGLALGLFDDTHGEQPVEQVQHGRHQPLTEVDHHILHPDVTGLGDHLLILEMHEVGCVATHLQEHQTAKPHGHPTHKQLNLPRMCEPDGPQLCPLDLHQQIIEFGLTLLQ